MSNPRDPIVQRLINQVLRGPGHLDPQSRSAAFACDASPGPLAAFVGKVHHHAPQIGEEDIAVLLAAGYSQDQIFEAIISAALGAGVQRRERVAALLKARS